MSDLPDGWEWTTLGEIAGPDGLFVDGDWVESKDQDPRGEVRLTQLADVGEGHFRDRSSRFLTRWRAEQLRCTYLEPDDILIARMPDPLGRACLYPNIAGLAVTVVDVAVLRPGGRSVDPRWLMWAINSPQVRDDVARYQTGSTRKRISRKNLARVAIAVPPLAEQRRIVAALEGHLSRLDAGRASLAKARKRLADYVVSGTHFATHSADGDETCLSAVAEVRLGRQRSPKNHSGDSMRPYIRAANVGWGGLILDDVKSMNFSDREVEEYRLKENDIVLSEASGSATEVGKPAIWRNEIENCCFQNTLIRVRAHGADPMFVYEYLRADAASGAFVAHSKGVGIHHIGAARLKSWPMVIPSPAEQRVASETAAEVRSRGEALSAALDAVSARAEGLRRSLLREAFAGRLVEQDAGDEPASVLLERIRVERESAPKARRGRKPRAAKGKSADGAVATIDPARPLPETVGKGTQDTLDLGL